MKYWSLSLEENKDRITNPDFQTIRDNFLAKKAARKAEAEKLAETEKIEREKETQEREIERQQAKKEREAARKEREAAERKARYPSITFNERYACVLYIKKLLKDPRSYKENNSWQQTEKTGLIDFTAKNSFGGVVRRVFDCNSYTFRE